MGLFWKKKSPPMHWVYKLALAFSDDQTNKKAFSEFFSSRNSLFQTIAKVTRGEWTLSDSSSNPNCNLNSLLPKNWVLGGAEGSEIKHWLSPITQFDDVEGKERALMQEKVRKKIFRFLVFLDNQLAEIRK